MTTFHKMQGLGNDFVVLDLRHQSFHIDPPTARHLADRHLGVGCDQILILRAAPEAHQQAAFEIWNSDGSRAEQCGNGVRCLGLYLYMQGETTAGKANLAGPAGEVHIHCLDNNQVQVDMGAPIFESAKIPISAAKSDLPGDVWYQIDSPAGEKSVGAVSMGNPHALIVVDDLKNTDISTLGAHFSRHTAFPEGSNAGFCEIVSPDEIQLRVFERGAAETLACGSGACAAMVILRRAGMVNKTVHVTQTGGMLIIAWTGGDEPVTMTGPAEYVFKGMLYE